MAINFSQVKAITIPEGSVKKITDSNGVVLWKAQTEGWHTVFEGSFSKTINRNSGRPTINICDLVDCEAPLKLRINGLIDIAIYNPIGAFTWIGESEKQFSNSKLAMKNKEVTATNSGIPASDSLVILNFKCHRYNYDHIKIGFDIEVSKYNNKTLRLNIFTNNLENYTLTLNITKIEQYY